MSSHIKHLFYPGKLNVIALLLLVSLQRMVLACAPTAPLSGSHAKGFYSPSVPFAPIAIHRCESLYSGFVSLHPYRFFASRRTICQMQFMGDFLGTILGTSLDDKNSREERRKRKEALLALLTSTSSESGRTSVVKRSSDIDTAIDALAEVSPVSNAVEIAKKLEKTWSLIWTTEKEINFFIEQGWSTNITQQILNDDTTLINTIPFVNDNGSFGVRGRIFRQEEDPFIRTQFVFETAILRWKWLPDIQFPPVGQGWFDTVYLDDDFRVDRNSRNDILVCRSLER